MTRLMSEFLAFAREEGRWWLLPVGVAAALISAVAASTQTPLAPFVYAMF